MNRKTHEKSEIPNYPFPLCYITCYKLADCHVMQILSIPWWTTGYILINTNKSFVIHRYNMLCVAQQMCFH